LQSGDISPIMFFMNDPYEQLIENLRADQRSLKQLEVESGVPEETIRDIKSGKVSSPRIDTLRAIAKCFQGAAQ
jgi:transcriptional regulator with XRE-family HTH domain